MFADSGSVVYMADEERSTRPLRDVAAVKSSRDGRPSSHYKLKGLSSKFWEEAHKIIL
jgi:hypothetical protein